MALTPEQLEILLQQILMTREREMNCSDCLESLAEFAETELQGKTLSNAMEAVRHHLALCVDCREEYETLLHLLKEIPPPGD